MIVKIPPSQIALVRKLFNEMDIHLPVEAILAGDIAGDVYADDPEHPTFALTWTGHHFYLAGAPPGKEGLVEIRQIFEDVYRPEALALDKALYSIQYPLGDLQSEWETAIELMLGEREPVRVMRQYYAWEKGESQEPPQDWRAALPEAIETLPVEAGLLAGGQIRNPEYLTEEMLSERASVEEFLAASFGVCLVHTNEIIGWCLSEYNTGHQCEVGIATREDFRRRGLATRLAWAFIEMALSRGVTRIGWHCSAENLPSGATAVKAGLEKITDYPIYLGWFDLAIHLTQRGYIALFSEQWRDSLRFFERSFVLGDLPDWAYWGAACAAARVGQTEQAFGYLDQAIEHGFQDVERLRHSEHLAGLHELPGWETLIERFKINNGR